MIITAKSLPEQAFEIIRERILSAELPPLAPVRQDALAEELGISKIPLREALTRLEQQGLLSSHPNRGYVVSALSADEAEEVFALRIKIEPAAAAAACRHADAPHREAATTALHQLEAALQTDPIEAVRCNRRFHLALVQNPRRKLTAQVLERLHMVAERYVRKHLEPQGRNERADREHRDILSAWLAAEAKTVEALLKAHLQTTLGELRQELVPGN